MLQVASDSAGARAQQHAFGKPQVPATAHSHVSLTWLKTSGSTKLLALCSAICWKASQTLGKPSLAVITTLVGIQTRVRWKDPECGASALWVGAHYSPDKEASMIPMFPLQTLLFADSPTCGLDWSFKAAPYPDPALLCRG